MRNALISRFLFCYLNRRYLRWIEYARDEPPSGESAGYDHSIISADGELSAVVFREETFVRPDRAEAEWQAHDAVVDMTAEDEIDIPVGLVFFSDNAFRPMGKQDLIPVRIAELPQEALPCRPAVRIVEVFLHQVPVETADAQRHAVYLGVQIIVLEENRAGLLKADQRIGFFNAGKVFAVLLTDHAEERAVVVVADGKIHRSDRAEPLEKADERGRFLLRIVPFQHIAVDTDQIRLLRGCLFHELRIRFVELLPVQIGYQDEFYAFGRRFFRSHGVIGDCDLPVLRDRDQRGDKEGTDDRGKADADRP